MPRSWTSASSTADADAIRFPYTIERGVRFPDEPIAGHRIRDKHVLETREPLRHQRARR